MTKWEYLLVSLPTFAAPKADQGDSAAVTMLDKEGALGWEAVGISTQSDGSSAVLMKRPHVSVGHTSGGRV